MPSNTTNWRERFEEEFGSGFFEDALGTENFNRIKSFTQTLLTEQAREIIDKIPVWDNKKDGYAWDFIDKVHRLKKQLKSKYHV
jgi:hypothetical protein